MSTGVGNGSQVESEGSLEALVQAFAMIIVSEVGDKTFLIAAILAMSNPRVVVFAGAFGSLVVMSILSAAMGHILPSLLPRRWTQLAAGILFLVFGAKMMIDGRQMKAGNEKIQEEMKEAEEEIEEDDARHDGTGIIEDGHVIPLEEMEEGGRRRSGSEEHSPIHNRPKSSLMEGARNFCSFFLGPVFVKAFVLTFLGEWGDRSQIATIALGAAHNAYVIAIGTIIGHGCCTAAAVIGGKYVSTKISVKHITLGGAVLFLLFGIIYLYESFVATNADEISSIHVS